MSSNRSAGGNDGGLLSLTELFKNTDPMCCVHCRQNISESRPLRCSGCKVVFYCSKSCQKANYSAIHRSHCRKIRGLRDQLDSLPIETQDVCNMQEKNACKFNLAYAIIQLGYHSTDTIDRGKYIYKRALLECIGIMRKDPFFIGACESVVLLLAILKYDGLCRSLIKFMLDPPSFSVSMSQEDRIRHYTTMVLDLDVDKWIYGPISESATRIAFSEYDKIRDKIPKYWGANNFLVPLMLITMRECSNSSLAPPYRKLKMMESVEISRQVEYSADFVLPVLRSLFPDSRQRWEKAEVCGLLANVDYRQELDDDDRDETDEYVRNRWEESCLIFWKLLKDCYALTPGILDILEETIDGMTRLGINVIPEDPDAPTTAEFMDFIHQMAEHQRHGTSPFD